MIAPEAPYPPYGGGALRAASLAGYLARRYALDLIVFREPGAPDPAGALPPGLFQRVDVLELPRHGRHPAARLWRNLGRAWRGAPPLNDRFGGFGGAIAAALRGRRYQIAVVEHLWCAPYLEQARPHGERVVLDVHNVESILLERCARLEPWPASAILRRFSRASAAAERRWLPLFDLVLASSAREAALIAPHVAPGRVCVYPNAIPVVPPPQVEEQPVLAFSGNLEYRPNRDAVRCFARRIWPRLRERWPELTWRLIGKNPEAVRRYVRGDARIEVTGPVEDAVRLLASARVVVAPLRAAAGTRLKILEAWAARRAVVSTSLGAEGLAAVDGEHLLIAETPEAFVASISRLLEGAELRARLGRAGRKLLEERYTWEKAWPALEAAGL